MSIACNFAGYCRPGASGQQRRGRGRACMHERALRHIRRLSIFGGDWSMRLHCVANAGKEKPLRCSETLFRPTLPVQGPAPNCKASVAQREWRSPQRSRSSSMKPVTQSQIHAAMFATYATTGNLFDAVRRTRRPSLARFPINLSSSYCWTYNLPIDRPSMRSLSCSASYHVRLGERVQAFISDPG